MKDKKPLAVGARCRVKDIEQLEGTVVSDTGIVVEESDAAVKVHHDHWPKDEWYLREQCRRLRKKPRPAKEERERVELYVAKDTNLNVALLLGEGEGMHPVFAAGRAYEKDKIRMVEIRPGELLVDRAKLAKAWDKNGCNKNIYPLHDHSEFFDMLCTALDIPAKEQK